MRRSKPALKTASFMLSCVIILNSQTAVAHNAKVHEGMTKRAYQLMLIVTRLNMQGKTMGSPPPGVTASQWQSFHADIAASMAKLDLLAKDPKVTIIKLADATSAPDYYTGDIHLFAKPSNMLGQSVGTKIQQCKEYESEPGWGFVDPLHLPSFWTYSPEQDEASGRFLTRA